MRKTLYIIISMSVLGFFYAQAQNDSISLDEVEVTAVYNGTNTKTSTPLQTLDKEKMNVLGIGSMTEALRHISGITVRDYGGAGGMKTVSVRGIGARHTGVVYDDMPVGDCQSGETDLSRFDTENISRMTLAIGDADNIFTPARNIQAAANLCISTLADSSFLQTRFAAGSWGTVSPSIKGAVKKGNAMVNFSSAYTHSDNNYPFTLHNVDLVTHERRSNSRMDALRTEAGIRWETAEGTIVDGKVYYYDNNRQLPGIVHLYTHDNDERLHERNAFAQAALRTPLSSTLILKVCGKATWASSLYHTDGTGGGLTSQSYWQREYYASSAFLFLVGRCLSADYSIDFAHNNLNTTLPAWHHPERNTLWQSLAMKYADRRLTAVARLLSVYCHDNSGSSRRESRNTHRLCPSASLSYDILPNRLMARASWKSTFRMPTFNELYYYHIGTDDLAPEQTSQWNAGLVAEADADTHAGHLHASLSADAYVADVNDKLIAIPFNMFVWRMMNLAKVRTTGIDVTADIGFKFNRRHTLVLFANYTHQKARNRSNPSSPNYNNQIAYIPLHTFAATLAWQNPMVDISITMDGMNERWTTNEHSPGTRIKGFVEMDVNIRRQLTVHGSKVTLTAAVLNILNKQYDVVAHYPMPGRSWRAGIEVIL